MVPKGSESHAELREAGEGVREAGEGVRESCLHSITSECFP